MPSKNIVKSYVENGYYHIYNRGVEKRAIFLDEQDCSVFLYYLKVYLTPVEELMKLSDQNRRLLRFIPQNLALEIDLLAFALMPNHIHLQIRQRTKDGIVKLMRRLSTSYVMYFNKKYNRVGSLFQNKYKGVLIENESYLLHLSRYIHLNPLSLKTPINFIEFSSYPYYLGTKKATWVKTIVVLDYFKNAQNKDLKGYHSYQRFVEDYIQDSGEFLGELALEYDHSRSDLELGLRIRPK